MCRYTSRIPTFDIYWNWWNTNTGGSSQNNSSECSKSSNSGLYINAHTWCVPDAEVPPILVDKILPNARTQIRFSLRFWWRKKKKIFSNWNSFIHSFTHPTKSNRLEFSCTKKTNLQIINKYRSLILNSCVTFDSIFESIFSIIIIIIVNLSLINSQKNSSFFLITCVVWSYYRLMDRIHFSISSNRHHQRLTISQNKFIFILLCQETTFFFSVKNFYLAVDWKGKPEQKKKCHQTSKVVATIRPSAIILWDNFVIKIHDNWKI